MRVGALSVIALGLLAACGSTEEQRAASGAGTGAIVGAIVGGPVGALAGAAAGGVGGTVLDEGVDKKAEVALGGVRRAEAGSGSTTRAVATDASRPDASRQGDASMGRDMTREAQQALQAQGYYHGRIDGIAGPQTKRAVLAYQQRQGLQQTGDL